MMRCKTSQWLFHKFARERTTAVDTPERLELRSG